MTARGARGWLGISGSCVPGTAEGPAEHRPGAGGVAAERAGGLTPVLIQAGSGRTARPGAGRLAVSASAERQQIGGPSDRRVWPSVKEHVRYQGRQATRLGEVPAAGRNS